MSDLILSWLNDEVQLSTKVTDFEKDFANGFLFGELLSKYNQQLNFNEFSNKDLRNQKINNFKLLEPTFKTLKIKFNAQIADGIIKQHKGAVYSILYNLKMALEKVHNPADIKVFDDTGKLNTIVPLKQIRPAREKFDSMESNLFSKRLNQRNKAQKEIDLDKKLEKFSEAQVKNEQKALERLREEQDRDKQIQEERRKIELNKLQRNITFMEDWQAKGWAEWTKNMKVKNEREKRDRDFTDTQNTKHRDRLVKHEREERQEVLDDITAFESNAQKFGIELEHDPEQTTKKVESTAAYATGPTTLSKLKEQTIKSENARRERDKRRRKMIVDQAKSQRDIEIKKREEILLEKLQQQSKQENEIAYEVWRALQCKEVIIENRNLRNDEYKLKKDTQTTVAQYKEERLLEQIFEENQRDFDQKMFRQRELNIHQLSESRLNDHRACSQVFDYIFEIAELCFLHQQDNDTNDIDPRFWRDCGNLFTENKPLVPRTTFRDPDATENLTKEPEPQIEGSSEQLAMAELHDYLNGLGAWKPIHQFDPPKDEEDNTYIPNAPLNNFNLGLLVSNLIDMKYPQREPIIVPADIPNYLPLKILSLGYDFSGRKTLAEFLKSKYDIQVLQINDILNEALESSDRILDEQSQDISEPPSAVVNEGEGTGEGEGEETSPKETAAVAVEQPKVVRLSDIGVEMKAYLAKGKEIPQSLYIKAIIAKIKEFYPSLTHEEFLQELRRMRGLPSKQELPPSHEQSQVERSRNSIDEIRSDVHDTDRPIEPARPKYTKGWVLMGYPNNYEQLKALENALSGFIPSDEQGNSEAENRKERAELVVKAPPKNIVPRKLIRGGLDTAIILDVTKEESLRRALGRRVDPSTGIVYHLEDNPPPVDQAPLIERLESINNPEYSEASLIDRLTRYDKNSKEMEDWIKIFGYEEIGVNCLQKFDGFGNREDIHAVVEEHINKLLEYKDLEHDRMLEEVEATARRKQEEEQQRIVQEQEDARMVLIAPEILHEGINGIQEKRVVELTISKELLEVLTSFWETVQEGYITSTKEVFAQIKKQRNFLSVRLSELQRRFLDMIQKEDDKLLLILKFQEEYNTFVEENPDMIEDNDTKEELHQRVEDLYQQLWEMIENKKEEAIEERKAIMTSGYIEDEMEFFSTNIQKLFQAELDRYFGCLQIINDYYNALNGKDLPEVPENFIFDILPKIVDALPPVEDSEGPEAFPRIELYYKNAIKILNGEEIEDLTLAKDNKKGKAPPPKKEDPKKAAAGKKGQEIVPEEVKELTPLEKELKATINTEKAIMRYRLYVIKSLAINRIKEMREKAKGLYTKLDDWLAYSIKAENDAVSELTNIMGEAIENQVKIQTELQLYYVDVINSRKQLNFYTPPIIPLPPRELKQPNRFTISQLQGLIGQVSAFTQPADIIENQTLLQFLTQRTMNTLSTDDLPDEWRVKNFTAYQKMIRNLDPTHKGYVPFKVLASYICLLATPLPNEEDILEYQTELYNNADENGFITREAFVNVPAFFDNHESSPHTEANSEVFTRVELLKDLLFEINGDRSKGLLNISEFINTITNYNNVGDAEETSEDKGLYQITEGESPLPSPGKKKSAKKSERELVRTYNNVLFD